MSDKMQDISDAIGALNSGNPAQAESICRRIINEYPLHIHALHLIGVAYKIQGHTEKAVVYLKKAYLLQPENTDIIFDLGCSLLKSGKYHEAENALRACVRIRPDHALAYSSLGNTLKRLGKYEEAIVCHQYAVSLEPLSAEMRSNLASAYLSSGEIDMAIDEYQNSVKMRQDSQELHFNLGTALQKAERFEDACISFKSALKLNPDHVNANMNIGTSLRALGRLDEALVFLRRAAELAPDLPDAQWNMSLALLMNGDFRNGWKSYEWRLKIPDIHYQKIAEKLWDGSVQKDKTLLIRAEQGMGDTIQFIRYAAIAREKVGKVILHCHPPLSRLLLDVDGVDQIISAGQSLPVYSLEIPLLSLPYLLGATLDNIPGNIPYLYADRELKEKWRLKTERSGYKIGIVWSGNPRHKDDHNRSCRLSVFRSLMKIPGTVFFSLQKDNNDTRSFNIPADSNIVNAGTELTDFADTAALISNLDLIISVDTAAAHLAGALGLPVWILLPFAPDWRWMLNRKDTPWYPTMKLFRQSRFGDWSGVFDHVEQALKEKLGS